MLMVFWININILLSLVLFSLVWLRFYCYLFVSIISFYYLVVCISHSSHTIKKTRIEDKIRANKLYVAQLKYIIILHSATLVRDSTNNYYTIPHRILWLLRISMHFSWFYTKFLTESHIILQSLRSLSSFCVQNLSIQTKNLYLK